MSKIIMTQSWIPAFTLCDACHNFASENENNAQLSQQLRVDKHKTLLGKPSDDVSWCDEGTIIAKKYGSIEIDQFLSLILDSHCHLVTYKS
jgi:hypothetical protein